MSGSMLPTGKPGQTVGCTEPVTGCILANDVCNEIRFGYGMGSPGTTSLGASRVDLAGNRAAERAGDSHQHARAGEASPLDNSVLHRDVDLAALGSGDSFDRSDGAPVSAAEVTDGARVGHARRSHRWHDSSHVSLDGAAGCYAESNAAGFPGGAV